MAAKDLTTIQKRVLEVIREFPPAANDDAALLDIYWHKYCDWDDTKSLYWNLSRSTQAETITRRRRELQNLGLITYSKEATRRREEAFNNERERAGAVLPTPGKAVSWLDDDE